MNGQRNVKILLIAPYTGLVKLFKEAVAKREDIELDAYESDTSDAASLIRTLSIEKYDIIISRGYTCQMIQSVCNRHVLDVGISIYDILRAIRLAQNYNGRFAVVGFQSIIYYAIVLKDVLQCELDVFTIRSVEEINSSLMQVKQKGFTMIVGDVVTTRAAIANGLQAILITTSPESVESVLDNSLSLYEEEFYLKRELKFYQDLIFHLDIGMAVYDQEGTLLFSNRLHGPNGPEALGKNMKKAVPALFEKQSLRFFKVIRTTRYTVTGKILNYGSTPMAVFYFTGNEFIKKENSMIRYFEPEEKSAVGQRTFYTLNPALEYILSTIRSFQFFSRPVVISGPLGSGKDSYVYELYRSCNHRENPMVIIDCSFASGKEWEYLLENEDSPLFGNGYVFYFKELHLLSEQQQNQLFLFLHHTAIEKRNQLIFSYIPDFSPSFGKSALKNEIVNILQSLVLTIPSLNERREDIPNLATLYLNELNSQMTTRAIAFEPDALDALQSFHWTDNLYQLRRVLQEAALCAGSSFITKEEILLVLEKNEGEHSSGEAHASLSVNGTLNDITRRVILQVLQEENMNQTKAAKRLGIGRSTLRRYM